MSLNRQAESLLFCGGKTMKAPIYGGIEGGGTKFVCAVGSAEGESLAETRFPTTTPEETLGRGLAFFQEQT